MGDMTLRSFRRFAALAALGAGLTFLPTSQCEKHTQAQALPHGQGDELGCQEPPEAGIRRRRERQGLGLRNTGAARAGTAPGQDTHPCQPPPLEASSQAPPRERNYVPTHLWSGQLWGLPQKGSALVLGCSACPQERGVRLPRPLQAPSEAVGSEHVKNGQVQGYQALFLLIQVS